jgi:hypothetical protein
MLAEIGRSYEELNKFWLEEIRRVVGAYKLCRIDPRDFEHWNNFHLSLKRTIAFWKVCFPSSTIRFPTDQNTVVRIGHQAVMLKPHTATIHPLL